MDFPFDRIFISAVLTSYTTFTCPCGDDSKYLSRYCQRTCFLRAFDISAFLVINRRSSGATLYVGLPALINSSVTAYSREWGRERYRPSFLQVNGPIRRPHTARISPLRWSKEFTPWVISENVHINDAIRNKSAEVQI